MKKKKYLFILTEETLSGDELIAAKHFDTFSISVFIC